VLFAVSVMVTPSGKLPTTAMTPDTPAATIARPMREIQLIQRPPSWFINCALATIVPHDATPL
jgi:hypothetical protein